MIAGGNIIERIQAMISDLSDETKADIRNHLNVEYISIAGQREWNCLTREVTLTTILPADCERVRYVQDDTDYLYFPIHAFDRYKSQRLYNWFENIRVATQLLTGTDGKISANDETLNSVTGGFTAGMVGEFVRIGENLGLYEIGTYTDTNNVDLVEKYRGADETTAYFEVRPRGTKQIALTDEQGDTITASATAKLWYLRRPLPIYNDYDMIELPGDCDAVRIGTLRRMMEQTKYDTDALRQLGDYNLALERMRIMDDQTPIVPTPRDRYGTRLQFGRRR